MIQMLEKIHELDNTIIVVTSDNGMPFPRAKANLYEQGTHVPLAIRWGDRVKPGRVVDDFVSFIDLAPTFLEAVGLKPPPEMTGRSLMNVLTSNRSGQVDLKRDRVFTGRERHSHRRHRGRWLSERLCDRCDTKGRRRDWDHHKDARMGRS